MADAQYHISTEQIAVGRETEENSIGQLQITLAPSKEMEVNNEYDLDKIIFDLNSQIDLLSNQADKFDYLVSIASGLLCGGLDILWVGEFSLERGRTIASEKVEGFVKQTAKLLGCKKDDLPSAVKFLEDMFPIPADGNTPDFGGGLQHHLRDFAHHPTLVGLVCSLLTQFTYKSYGTDVNGNFIIVDVPEKSRVFIGVDPHKDSLWNDYLVFSSCKRYGRIKQYCRQEWRNRHTWPNSGLGKGIINTALF